jgi:hypothetical protein
VGFVVDGKDKRLGKTSVALLVFESAFLQLLNDLTVGVRNGDLALDFS